ncbi:MAG: hypothetical protein AAB263_15880, partial [Planctomycetota bacterium]
MNRQQAQTSLYDDWSWVIGEEKPDPKITAIDKSRREGRIAAIVFKRRARLLLEWRLQAHRMYAE